MLEQELFDLLDGTSDAAFTVTDQGEICSWNRAAETLFGYSASEVHNTTCYSLLQGHGCLGAQLCGESCSVRDCASKGLKIPNFDLEVKNASGRWTWVSMSTIVFENSRNHRRLVVHLAHDITARKKAEELLHKMVDVSRQLVNINVGANPAPIIPLSGREQDILRLFSLGKNAGGVARELQITLQTLRNHLHHINKKLHTHNRLEAVTHAMQRKLL